MAVTIDELEIDINSAPSGPAAQAPAAAPPKEPVDMRKQFAMLAERAMRLSTD